MTHVTQLGLWALWLGLEGISLKEAARSPSWVEYVADGVARLAGCDSDEGYMDRFVYADEVSRRLPTCPHCAVLCDMARGAE